MEKHRTDDLINIGSDNSSNPVGHAEGRPGAKEWQRGSCHFAKPSKIMTDGQEKWVGQ